MSITENMLYWSDIRPLYLFISFGGAAGLFLFGALPAFGKKEKKRFKPILAFPESSRTLDGSRSLALLFLLHLF